MFIVIIPPLDPRSSGAQCLRAAATSGSAGAVINYLGRGYKHLFPPGPRQCSSNTLLPHYAVFRALDAALFPTEKDTVEKCPVDGPAAAAESNLS
jgi:hypothetical protein